MATVAEIAPSRGDDWNGRAPTDVMYQGVPYRQDRRHLGVRDYLLRIMLEELYRLEPYNEHWRAALEKSGNTRLAAGAWTRKALVKTRKVRTHQKVKTLAWDALLPLPLEVFDPEKLAKKLASVEVDAWRELLRRSRSNPIGSDAQKVEALKQGYPAGFDFEDHYGAIDQRRYEQARVVIDRYHEKVSQVK